MIINLRGTHGSGKSYVAKQIITRFDGVPIGEDKRGNPLGYAMQLDNGKALYVVGRYDIACGGCDAIQPYSLIWPRVVEFAKLGHVLFEGALVSSSYGNIGRASEVYGEQFVFAFLNTPMSVCLERIRKRREAKGNLKPLNPKNTQYKFDNIQHSIPKIRNGFHRRVIILDYHKAIPQLLGVLHGT